MKTLKFISKLMLAAVLGIATFASCNPDDENGPAGAGVYVLNNGSWGANNATIARYSISSKEITADAFKAANGVDLGDLGQDILVYGKEIYIAVNGSQKIFVTDLDLKIKKAITAKDASGADLSPRYFCIGGGKVYVTYYEGFLGEIDPKTYAVRTTAVGPNPEGLAYNDGKIYTADSGGYIPNVYNNTVTVVDAATFKKTKTITVNTNPNQLFACGSKLYLSSFGNYATIAPKVQCIDASTETVTDLDCSSPSAIALNGNNLYVLCGGYDAEWNPLPGSVIKFNATNATKVGAFVTDDTTLPNAYSISATKKYVWVGCSDYKTNGDVYVFKASDGKLYDKFDSQGINPLKVAE